MSDEAIEKVKDELSGCIVIDTTTMDAELNERADAVLLSLQREVRVGALMQLLDWLIGDALHIDDVEAKLRTLIAAEEAGR